MSAGVSDVSPAPSPQAPPLVALVGQPNCGKTTLFNRLTGSHFRTTNYPGATVEYSVGALSERYGLPARILDSPGLGSLNAHAPDEAVTVQALFRHPTLGTPDVVVVVVDATQLARHLYLAEQIIHSGFVTVLAVTMGDLLTDKGYRLDAKLLGTLMACEAVLVDSRAGDGHGAGVEALCAAVGARLAEPVTQAPALVAPQDDAAVQAIYERVEAIERAVVVPLDPAHVPPLHAPLPMTARLDAVFLHPVWGLLIFAGSMMAIFTAIFWLAAPAMDAIDGLFGWLSGTVAAALPGTWYGALLANGVISGFGSVVMFLPQIAILFLAMSFLEDSGYLARGAMLVDRPLAAIGLNGRSFVPMLSGFACAIPGIMAARTIPSRKERLLTIFILPLMSCSARLPVYTLLLGFLVPHDQPWLGGLGLTVLYVISLASGSVVAALAGRFMKLAGPSVFLLELPAYRRPQWKIVLRSTYFRAKNYLQKATVPIMVVATVLWALTTVQVPGSPVSASPDEAIGTSLAAWIGHGLDPVMAPLGLDWRAGVALIAAFGAREVFVSSLALVMKVSADGDALQGALLAAMRQATLADGVTPMFTPSTVIGLIVFFIFALQCLATVVVSAKESGSRRLAYAQVGFFTGFAYVAALVSVHGARFLGLP